MARNESRRFNILNICADVRGWLEANWGCTRMDPSSTPQHRRLGLGKCQRELMAGASWHTLGEHEHLFPQIKRNIQSSSAYTEVREKDHFPNYWGYIKEEKLEKAGKICTDQTDKNCASTVSVGGCTSSEFIAVLQHKFGPLPEE
ncbi:Os04g0308300 [Oryza sativa Japonica Group]|uniref:OSJNBa0024J22.13 protein n=1 Tax=Oryza sativa subsp. japonica TaxID=39947 RepID=Q7XRN5_ORYSJ|nr:Os04g0308300 [Oryza sativa Japonica Group]CAE02409.2 OSJNBa0024J22.13 [Oryza sativa Japonica Group]|eukprot:NP_001052425.1 Os04g0308300 [Oryza sativa Japonica Group]